MDIFKATTAGSIGFMLIGFVIQSPKITPLFVLLFWLSSTTFTLTFRSILRYTLKKVRLRGRNQRLVIIVGTNKRAYDFANMIEERKELGYRLLGFIDDMVYLPREDIKLLGPPEKFPDIVKNRVVDDVFIALPVKSYYEKLQKIVESAEENGIIIRYLSELFNTKIAQLKVEAFEHFSMLTITSGPQEGWQYLFKRLIDIIMASVFIVLTFPVMLLAVIAIKLSSPGPILFTQDRVGRNKRIFKLYKFRTMENNAEHMQLILESQNEMDGPVFKIKNDPRITKVGKYLRKWSIDEIPQLFNVLKGDMSLVGPRPLPVRDFNGIEQDWQRRRFSILPGITCTWQISGRNEIPYKDWIKMDMEYIDNWKLSRDLKILIKTIPAVMKGKGL